MNRRTRMLECGGFRVQAMLVEDARGVLTLAEGGVKETVEKRKAEVKEKRVASATRRDIGGEVCKRLYGFHGRA